MGDTLGRETTEGSVLLLLKCVNLCCVKGEIFVGEEMEIVEDKSILVSDKVVT